MKWITCLCIAAAIAVQQADKVTEPETGTVFEAAIDGSTAGSRLLCTGTGCRKKSIFGVKIYAIAHWIDGAGANESLSAWKGKAAAELQGDQAFYDALSAADVEKRFKLVFVYKVSAKEMRQAFRESLELGYTEFPKIADDFVNLFTADIAIGDAIELRSFPGGTIEAWHKGKSLGRLGPDPVFAKAVWGIYFDKKLADNYLEQVKKELVGDITNVW